MSLNSEWPEMTEPAPPPPPEAMGPAVPSKENPPWNGWDVLRIAALMFVVPYMIIPIVALIVQRSMYPRMPLIDVAQKPWLALSTQFGWYLVVLAYMIMFVEGTFHQRFWLAVRWSWPRRSWPWLIALGVALVSLEGLERFFHVPSHIPLEDFLKTPLAAALTMIFAVSFGPFMEELFFRGFMYPALARRLGVFASVLLTSVAFGLIHGAQLGFAWGLVFIIFLVGLALTIVRAKTGSVASSFVVHVSYNATLSILGAAASHYGMK